MSEVVTASLDAGLIPADGTKAQAVYRDGSQRVVAIGMAAGSSLAEHAAPGPVNIHVALGRVAFRHAEGQVDDAEAGTWFHLPAGMVHAVEAHEPSLLVVTLVA